MALAIGLSWRRLGGGRVRMPLVLALAALCCPAARAEPYTAPEYQPVKDPISGRTGQTEAVLAAAGPKVMTAKLLGSLGTGDSSTVPGMRLCPSADEAAKTMVGGNTLSLTVSNAKFTQGVCVGTNAQWGIVDTWATGHALATIFDKKALVLSSGYAGEAEGIWNDNDAYSLNLGRGGDADLNSLVSPRETYDATVLEFDVTPASDGLLVFQYLFASEEYDEWVGSAFNDVFALWVSDATTKENVAVLPYSTTAVAINNVNFNSFSQYYNDNDLSPRPSGPFPPSPYATQYDGFTDLLNTKAYPVTAGTTYHLKVAVADVSDHIYDSSIFIAGSSLSVSTPPVAVLKDDPYTLDCPGSVTLDGSTSYVTTAGASIDTYKWELTSTDGKNYKLVYYGASTTLTAAPNDNIPDGTYDLTLTVTDTQGLSATSTTTFTAKPCSTDSNNHPPVPVLLGAPYAMTICLTKGTATLDASKSSDPDAGDSVVSYAWTITSNAGFQLKLTGATVDLTSEQGFNAGNDYNVQLLISDKHGAVAGTSTTLTVQQSGDPGCKKPPPHDPPVANPGGPYTIGCENTINLDGSASTVASGYGSLTYTWTISSLNGGWNNVLGPTGSSKWPISMTGIGLIAGGKYTVTLSVYDNTFLTSTASTTLSTPKFCSGQEDHPPIADFLDAPYTICAKSTAFVILDGTPSWDIDYGDSIQGYFWKILDGDGAVVLANPTPPQPNESGVPTGSSGPATWQVFYSQLPPGVGEFTVILTVIDVFGKPGWNKTTLIVLDKSEDICVSPPPVANAGGPYALDCDHTLTLDGSLSTVPEGSAVTYNWSFALTGWWKNIGVSNQPYMTVSLSSLGLEVGTGPYTVVLTVTNDEGEASTADTSLTIPANCTNNTKGEGDPHFVGAHGTHFDFNGELGHSYCLLTDKGIHLNAKLRGYTSAATVGSTMNAAGKGVRSWMGELGLIWTEPGNPTQHKLHLVARTGKGDRRGDKFLASVTFDGRSASIPSSPGTVLSEGAMSLMFMESQTKPLHDVDRFRLVLKGKIDIVLHVLPAAPKYQQPDDSYVHFDLHIYHLSASGGVHGVLGQTYRNTPTQYFKAAKYQALAKLMGEPIKADGSSGYGFLDGAVQEYAASNILMPDCKRSSFE